ncbi:unnamed protein product [Effrenium voratum]|uniref:Uncharacterized protein n=1 Tax=Effrenium voratum TaxID=2562239 RepID=A0AA36J6Z4_9DINO|nr:unnamed protein product [Effrenium voratum]CAJ1419464.1 unnamed protein product [Effrenium voratum]
MAPRSWGATALRSCCGWASVGAWTRTETPTTAWAAVAWGARRRARGCAPTGPRAV